MLHEGQYNEWDLSHFSTEGAHDRNQTWPQQHYFHVHNNLFLNVSGTNHADSSTQKDGALSILQQTTLGLRSLFIPDINTTAVLTIFSS